MFGLSKQEKEVKLQNQYQSELKDLMMKINADTGRSDLFASIRSGGYDFSDALHNVYCDFGYPATINFFNLWNMYRRFGPAKAVVDIPPDLCWLTHPEIKSENAQFDADFNLLVKNTNFWNRLKGLDKRQRVGRYAGLFIQAADNQKANKEISSVSGVSAIHNLKPIYEGQLEVSTTEDDQTDPNFGNPTMYNFISGTTGNRNDKASAAFQIHPSRIIIAAEGADDGSIYGISSLESIFNDLMDLRKIAGAGGEGFYQNTRSAPVIEIGKEFQAPKGKEKEALETEIDDFLSKWQKKFVAKGMTFVYPNISLNNPKEFAENSWNNISSGSQIPANVIRGSQTGVLAGDKDSATLLTTMQSRRENYLTELVRDTIDWMIKNGALPSAEYEIEWDDLADSSSSDKVDLGKKMASINADMFRSGLPPAFTEDEIREASGFEPADFELPTEELDEDAEE